MHIRQKLTGFSLCLVAWCTLAVAPTFAQTVTHVPLFRFDGDPAGDGFAVSVSGAGDVNGDGSDDLIVGANGEGSNTSQRGKALVFSGSDGGVLYTFDGDSALDRFGWAVSGAGDVNGDGFDDLIVGARNDDNNGTNSGSARVLSGSDGSVLYSFDGDNAGDGFGNAVSGVGDVNGDGFDDLIVGAVADDNNGTNSGSARVFSGSDGSILYNFEGDLSFDILGGSVSGAGDVNGDGAADLIVGVYGDDNNGSNSGSVRVFSGSDGSVLYNFNGDSAGDRFGISVSGARDVNGDGFDDLIVGAYGDDNNGLDSGSARVFSGFDGSILYNFDGDSAGDEFGWSVSGAGDVNGDGLADLIVGARRDEKNGENTGSVRVLSGADGSVLYNFDGDNANDRFGYSVSGAGDVNADGVDDFIVGANSQVVNRGSYAVVFVSQITVPLILGDCNQDGEVNFLDINPFISILQTDFYVEQADCNQDDDVNFLDISPFIAILAGG